MAINVNRSRVRRLDSRQNFHQRTFTSAIFSNNGQNLGLVQFQVHIIQRDHAGKRLPSEVILSKVGGESFINGAIGILRQSGIPVRDSLGLVEG